ncbi:site-specific integrase [Bacillus tianshenii]|nr:site-specific integrase [Bacillus tianshenii]
MNMLHETILPDDVVSYLEYLAAQGRRPSTIKRYKYDLEDFFRYMNEQQKDPKKWKTFSNEDYHTFFHILLTERHYSLATMKRMHTVLKRLNRFYQIKHNPPEISMHLEKKRLGADDFIQEAEKEKLLQTVVSTKGLTDNQLKARHLLFDRNLSIVRLLLDYGLTLHELASLRMKDVHFERNELDIPSVSSLARTIKLSDEDKQLLYRYLKTIPEPVRPRYHSHDPLFAAFDFQRCTYRWVYEKDAPKRLTEIAIQKMIREEIARAGLRKGISAQHMRNTCIINQIQEGLSAEDIQRHFGFKTPLSLKRFYNYLSTRE